MSHLFVAIFASAAVEDRHHAEAMGRHKRRDDHKGFQTVFDNLGQKVNAASDKNSDHPPSTKE